MAKKVMKKSAPKVKKDANQKQTKPVKEPKPFKKPASLPFDPPKEEGMSLEAKIELFQKRKGGGSSNSTRPPAMKTPATATPMKAAKLVRWRLASGWS